MKAHPTILGLLAIATVAGPSASAKNDYVYGPAPDWQEYKELGARAVLAKMPDPTHWIVEWPNAYVKAGWGARGRTGGYLTCGALRAVEPVTENRYFINFAIVIDHGSVKLVDIATSGNSAPNVLCPALIKKGMLPPASTMAQASEFSIASLGITARAMPEGAYVASVAGSSVARQSGLAAGMVITKLNGIPLSGMGGAMAKVLDSDESDLTLTLAAGETIIIRRAK